LRFAIRIDPIWRPFLLFIGATPSNSYVELHDDAVRMRFGRGFDQAIARDNIASMSRGSWSWINGMGVIAGGSTLGLVGSTRGIVEIRLRTPVALRYVGYGHQSNCVAVSLRDAEGFISFCRSQAWPPVSNL
jgi:hypothetical protein